MSSAARIETALWQEVSAEVQFVLGNQHYNVPDLHQCCEQADRFLVTVLEDLSVSPLMRVGVLRVFLAVGCSRTRR